MIILSAMLIPFVTAAVLWFLFQRKTKWWEFLLPFGLSLILAMFFHFTTSFIQAMKNEYWTGYLTRVEYFEDWNEKVYYTERVEDGTESYRGSDGKRHTRTKYKTVRKSRIDYHAPYWVAIESTGQNYSIDSSTYKKFAQLWGTETFINLHRNYYTKNGNKYSTGFNGKDSDMEVATSIHQYQNKVVLSRSVFNFPDVPKEKVKTLGLFEYPPIEDQWVAPSILGADVPRLREAQRRLAVFNARHGSSQQIRVWILVFKDQSLTSGFEQQNYWKNGNKNEFVICIGVNQENKVQWGHAFSWTDISSLAVDARNKIVDQQEKTIDLSNILDWVETDLSKQWVRKNFKDFDYLQIDPPWWAILITILVTAGANVGLSYWITTNEFSDEPKARFS